MKRYRWAWTILLAAAIFALNVLLNWPLFQDGAQPYRGSIEAGYAGIARFFSLHPNPWGWNPYIYCGLPTQFTYLPGAPYTVALLMWWLPQLEALHAYRIVSAFLACLGPVTLFLFALYATGSKWWSLAAALGYTLCSPSYDLFQTIDKDRGLLPIPWRLHVMVKYGEGPHNVGLTLLPLALLGVMAAACRTGFPPLFFGALALAAVALTHWIAAFALTLCVLLYLLVYRKGGWRVVAAGALAYGLACFWLTPTFIQTVAFNWPQDSFGYKLAGRQRLAIGLIVLGVALIWWLFRKRPEYRYLCFVTLSFFIFAAFAESHYAHGVDAIPESRRYALEMELFLALALAEWMRVGWTAGGGVNRFCVLLTALLLVVQGMPQASHFIREGYAQWTLKPKEQTVEYRIARWLAARAPSGRVHVSGGLKFRLNSWFDVAQTNGTFDSGLRSRNPLNWDYQFRTLNGVQPGRELPDSLAMLQAMGTEYLVVHGPGSEEYYRDTKNPTRFEGTLEKVYAKGEDEVFRVPFRSLAHLVKEDELAPGWQPPYLERFVSAFNDARPKLAVDWEGPNHLRIYGAVVPPSTWVSILSTYDQGWRATHGGKPVEVASDPLGYLLVKPTPGSDAPIVLEYRPTWEKITMAVVSVLTWIGATMGMGIWLLRYFTKGRVGNPVLADGI